MGNPPSPCHSTVVTASVCFSILIMHQAISKMRLHSDS